MTIEIDFSKVTPAPWHYTGMDLIDDNNKLQSQVYVVSADDTWIAQLMQTDCEEDAAFIALSKNAEDVMMRRGWSALKSPISKGWRVDTYDGYYFCYGKQEEEGFIQPTEWNHPFIALVEADEWQTEHENKDK